MATITLEVPDELARQWRNESEALPFEIADFLELVFVPGETTTKVASPLAEVALFLGATGNVRTLLNFRFSPGLQGRFMELLDSKSQGHLSPGDQIDFSDHLRAIWLVAILRTRLRPSLVKVNRLDKPLQGAESPSDAPPAS